jgi:hypothetical protein
MAKEIKLSQNKFAIVDNEDFDWLNQWKWHINNYGYAVRLQYVGKINGKYKYESVLMSRLIMNAPEEMEVDHIDRNPLNNTKYNLRIVTHQQNNFNKPKNKNNTSGFKGVYFDGRRKIKKWYVKIEIDYKQKFSGYFLTITEAIICRRKMEELYHAI